MPILKRILEALLIALVYSLSGKLGQTMAILPGHATPIWPPAGVALAFLLLLGNRRALPGLLIGAYTDNLSFLTHTADILVMANVFLKNTGVVIGAVVQPIMGVYLIQHFIGREGPLYSIKSFLRFIAIIPIMCLFSASFGTSSLVLGGSAPWSKYTEIWLTWWLGDSIGTLATAPLLLVWWNNWRIKTTPVDVLETAAIFVGICVTSWIAFGSQENMPLEFLPIPVLLWAGLRLDLRGSILSILLVEVVAIWNTLQGFGPFQSDNINYSLMLIQLFIGVFTTTTMIVALFVKERNDAQQRLREERQNQFAQLVEGLGSKYFYYTHNTVGVFTYVSESVRELLGYAPEEFKRHFETFLPDTPLNQAAVAHTEGSIRGEQQSIYEIDIFHKDGSTRRIEVFERPVFDDEGQVVGVEGMSCDITDRIAEGEKFAALLNSAPDGMIISDDQGKITLVNTRTEEMFGYQRDELIGQAIEILMPENVRVYHPQLRIDFVSGHDIRSMGIGRELTAQRKDGSVFSVEISLSPLQTEDGLLISAAVRDITERKKAEQALSDGEEYKSAILESSLDCLISMDHEGRIIEFNPAAEKVFGYKREDVIGKILSETIVPPAFREAHDNGLKHYLQTGDGPVLNQRIEITALHANGEEFPVELAISSIERGDAPIFTAFIRDITVRKQAEEALAESENRLNLAMDTSGVGLWDFNTHTGETYLSPQYFAMLDYGPQELSHGYDTWQKLLHPDDRERVTEQFGHFVSSGHGQEIYEDEYRMVTKTGEDRWIFA